jgi:hypothetical protein
MSESDRSTLAGTLMIVSGVLTVVASAGIFATFVWVCVGALWLVPMAVGIGEVFVGAAIMGGRPTPRVRTMSAMGILSALMCGNVIGAGLEIGSLILVAKATPPLLDEQPRF